MDVRLRPFEPGDLAILYAQQLDPEATEMANFPARDEAAFAAHWEKILADPTTVIAVAEADGEVAGSLGSWPQDDRRYVGYWFGREFWGRGIATAALGMFVRELPERPLHAHVAVHNIGSQRVLERNGFTPVERDDIEILYTLA